MLGKNPKDPKAISGDKSWNSSYENDRIGWMNYDELNTSHQTTPMKVYPLGRVLTDIVGDADGQPAFDMAGTVYEGSSSNNLHGWPEWISAKEDSGQVALWGQGARNIGVPGIMAMRFDQTFGASSDDTREGVASKFKQWWLDLRFDQNMTENFESGDLQFISVAVMNWRMHMANVRRVLELLQSGLKNVDSKYAGVETLLAAIGFPLNLSECKDKLNGWIDTYNKLVGNFNQVTWFKNICPGERRWESLVREIYKDTPADTKYSQLYVLTPQYYYRPKQYMYQPSPTAVAVPEFAMVSAFTEGSGASATFHDYTNEVFTYRAINPQSHSTAAIGKFDTYLKYLEEDLETMFWDSGLINILVTIKSAWVEKTGLEFTQGDLEYLDKATNREIKHTWDFRLMLAIHNATICPTASALLPSQVVGHGAFVAPGSGEMYHPKIIAPYNNGYYMSNIAKVIDLPSENIVYGDMLNALQWCLQPQLDYRYEDAGYGQTSAWQNFDPAAFGVDHISSAQIYFYTHMFGDTTLGTLAYKQKPVLRMAEFSQFIFEPGNFGGYAGNNLPVPQSSETLGPIGGNPDAPIFSERLASVFLCAPIRYWATKAYKNGANDDTWHLTVYDISGDTDIIWACTRTMLREIHIQMNNNFWGYPMHVPKQGSLQTNLNDQPR